MPPLPAALKPAPYVPPPSFGTAGGEYTTVPPQKYALPEEAGPSVRAFTEADRQKVLKYLEDKAREDAWIGAFGPNGQFWELLNTGCTIGTALVKYQKANVAFEANFGAQKQGYLKNPIPPIEPVGTSQGGGKGGTLPQGPIPAVGGGGQIPLGQHPGGGNGGGVRNLTPQQYNDVIGRRIAGLNPGPLAGNNNCADCAVATDLLLRTGQVIDIGSRAEGIMPGTLAQMYRSPFYDYGNTIAPVTQRMSQLPTGSTGILFLSRGPLIPGHFINVVNNGGQIEYWCGQTGQRVTDPFTAFSQPGRITQVDLMITSRGGGTVILNGGLPRDPQ